MVGWKVHCTSTNLLSPKEAETLFSNVELLLGINQTLLTDLKKVFADWDSRWGIIGKTMTEFANFFKLYKDYCNNKSASEQQFRLLMDSKDRVPFQEYIK